MKSKPLIASLIIIVTMVLASLFLDKGNRPSSFENKSLIKVGILQLVTHEALNQIEKGIQDELQRQPISGKRIEITLMNAEGDQSKIQTMSHQLVTKGSDILVGIATPAAQGLAAATKEIPVIMSAVTDPVGAKLVKDLSKPEANVTGLSNRVPLKQTVSLMKRLTPEVKKIAVLYASNEDNSLSQVKDFTHYARSEGYQVFPYAVPSTNEVPSTMSIISGKVDAIFLPQDNTIASAFSAVISASNAAKLPVYSSVDTMVEAGSLASVSQNQYQLGVETAKQIKALVAGKKVSQVPVKIVDNGKAVINQKVADRLGITIPESLAKTADILDKK